MIFKKVDDYSKKQPEIVAVDQFPDKPLPDVTINGEIKRSTHSRENKNSGIAVAATARVVKLAADGPFYSKEIEAAVTIQAYYRGYLVINSFFQARRALRALKALVRVQALVRGHNVRKQAQMTMHCMKSLLRVQARIRAHKLLSAHEKLQSQPFDLEEQESPFKVPTKSRRQGAEDEWLNAATWDDKTRIRDSINGNPATMRHSAATKGRQSVYSSSSSYQVDEARGFERSQYGSFDRWISTQLHEKYHSRDLRSEENTFVTFATTVTDETSDKTVDWGGVESSPCGASTIISGRLSPLNRRNRPTAHRQCSDSHVPSYMAPTQSAKAKSRRQDSTLKPMGQQPPPPLWNLSIKGGSHRIERGNDTSTQGGRASGCHDPRSPGANRSHGMRFESRRGFPSQGM